MARHDDLLATFREPRRAAAARALGLIADTVGSIDDMHAELGSAHMRPRGEGIVKFEILDDIVAETAAMVESPVAEYPEYEVEFALAAPGGDWNASQSIFAALCNHARRVTAHIERAASGGALIAMAADVRVLRQHGFFFLHRPNGPYAKAMLDKIADKKAELMASRCRIPQARLRRWMERTVTLDADQALHYGLATEVPGMKPPITPTVFL